jgi:hypothetical protein
MTRNVTPMIHVPDVRAAVEWYQSIGFTAVRWNEEDGVMDWAMLSFGEGVVMFNAGGKPSMAERREVDLYVYVENIDDLYEDLKDRVEVVEPFTTPSTACGSSSSAISIASGSPSARKSRDAGSAPCG